MKWNKNDLVEDSKGVQRKCIAADCEYAVFAETFIDLDGDLVVDFEDINVYSNDEVIGKNDKIYPIKQVTVFRKVEYWYGD
jgi:hypothetical protein